MSFDNIALPDYSDHVRELAKETLNVLVTSIHWMKAPDSPTAREILIRRWAGGIANSRLSDDAVRKAVAHYLNNRWAKDPVPEPRDVFTVSDELVQEWMGEEAALGASQMRAVRKYLTIARNWRGHWDLPVGGEWGTADFNGHEYFYGGRENAAWEGAGMDIEIKPDNLASILDQLGEKQLADINREFDQR